MVESGQEICSLHIILPMHCEDLMEQTIPGMIVIGVGLLSIVGALLNWRIAVGSGKLIPRLLGPVGAKIFMITLGLVLIGLGVCIFAGPCDLTNGGKG